MNPIKFPEANVTFAENQPEYLPLPAHKTEDGQVITCWELSPEEIEEINKNKRLWLIVHTFNNPLQPLFLTTQESVFVPAEKSNEPENLTKNPNETQSITQTEPKNEYNLSELGISDKFQEKIIELCLKNPITVLEFISIAKKVKESNVFTIGDLSFLQEKGVFKKGILLNERVKQGKLNFNDFLALLL